MSSPSVPLSGRPATARRSAGDLVGRVVAWLVPVLPLAFLVVMFAVPLGYVVVYSFANATFGGVELGFTLDNYREALSGFYLQIFWRTIRFALIGTVLCLAIAVPLAYVVARKAGRFKTPLLILVLIPFWTSFLIRALSWKTLLDNGGPVERLINTLHLHSGSLNWIDGPNAVFVGIVYSYLPMAVIPLYVAFERIPSSNVEASKDLGAGQWRTFRHVTLPMARAGLVTAVLLTFVPMTGEFVVPSLLGGSKGVLVGNLVEDQYLSSANYALGSAMAVLLLIVLGFAIFLFGRLARGSSEVTA
jgi:ABC-type spermidine/putrescine transport system permease subunit I